MQNDRELHRNLVGNSVEKLKASRDPAETAKFPDTGDRGDRPREPYGLTGSINETTENTGQSEGQDQGRDEPDDAAFVDKDLLKSRTL